MFDKLLIANRGEIALRILRAARDLGIATVAVFSRDDADAPHAHLADEAVALDATGPAAYLDIAALVAAARRHGCDAVHPGYGFLSERADFARACAEAGLVFIGPTPGQLELFGDKALARALAAAHGVPLLPGTGAASLAELQRFFDEQRGQDPRCGLMLKAVAGGGGRGMRVVLDPQDLPEAHARCSAEARAAFGLDAVYAERLMPRARHLEVQVLGDGHTVMALGERECTLQRRFQKLVEIAPSPWLDPALRQRLADAALTLARAAGEVARSGSEAAGEATPPGSEAAAPPGRPAPGAAPACRGNHPGQRSPVAFSGLCTVEFLVDTESPDLPVVFIEVNPRLQVEHTVTEAVTGVDLVTTQIALAAGHTLASLGLDPAAPPPPRGTAVQWRINAETLDDHGQARPSGGTLTRADFAAGPGVRVDTAARAGLAPSPLHDTLLAKLVVHHGSGGEAGWAAVLRRSRRALAECRLEGLATNLPLLRALAGDAEVAVGTVHTRWLEEAWPALRERMAAAPAERTRPAPGSAGPTDLAGNTGDGGSSARKAAPDDDRLPDGLIALRAPMPGRLVAFSPATETDAPLPAGTEVLVLEAMKMQHGVALPEPARIVARRARPGEVVHEGQVLLWLAPADGQAVEAGPATVADPAHVRADLQRALDRIALTADDARPEAVARRHAQGGRTARENIADLCDPGSFQEYGGLAIAAQQRRRSLDDLQRNTPADGLVTGIGSVNGDLFGPERSRTAVLAYDYTVLAGTQGWRNHQKKDRLLKVIHDAGLPTVLFAEGGGGRPGDVDMPIVAGLNNHTFSRFAELSGRVPVLGIAHGRCFAGNAALLGCCDTVIATRAANIGMGGPAMIEGGGLGVFRPEDIGPAPELARAGVVDLLVDDEAQAVDAARRYLGYFQGALPEGRWSAADPRHLRHAVPEDRLRAYDMRALVATLADTGSVLELRAGYGAGLITALIRIEGRPMALMASNPQHLGGAIDPEAADKGARFLQLAQAHGLPVLSLCDTPGFMVGPEVERQGQVRHACRLFLAAARLTVPAFTVVVRKGYGLGAQAMALGGFDAPVFTVAWPTGEFGAMGLEGAVRLGFRKELEAAPAGAEREALYQRLVAQQYAAGSALNMAQMLEIDAVIDPGETRGWVVRGLRGAGVAGRGGSPVRAGRVGGYVDGW
jgi:acetyl/propionyl-CoA carboxylase alpha subunit/acetyl-CoA carboxylase carboxyltransferase component